MMDLLTQKIHYVISQQMREDFAYFLHKSFETIRPDSTLQTNWHLSLIAETLTQVYKGGMNRVMVNLPPRYLKSLCISVAFPAWVLAIAPSTRMIVVTYSKSLSSKHSTDCRRIMSSNWYKESFPNSQIIFGENTKTKFLTEKGGGYFATSVGGTLLGEGGDIIIVDDPQSPSQAFAANERDKVFNWFQNVLLSRLDNKTEGKIVILMQRLHEDDLCGRLLKNFQEEWQQLKLPAIALHDEEFYVNGHLFYTRKEGEVLHKTRDDKKTLEKIAKTVGMHAFLAQYQQDPLPASGALVQKEWIQYCDKKEIIQSPCYVSIDCAKGIKQSNDYTAIAIISQNNNKHYLIEMHRKKLQYTDLRKLVQEIIAKFKPVATLIEDSSNGSSLIQELKSSGQIGIIAIRPKGDKISRFNHALVAIEGGHFIIPKEENFVPDLIQELLSFPIGKHDDQVDAIGQYFAWQAQYKILGTKSFKIRIV